MENSPAESTEKKSTKSQGQWIAVGIAIGVAVGVAIGKLALGIGIGVALGAAIGFKKSKREQ
jgi:hypothetical protein